MALPALLRDSLSIPAVGAPLFIVSNPDLVIEQCKAGIVGAFPALNARPKEMLETWLQRITTELREYKQKYPDRKVAPFAVNQIVHSSQRSPAARRRPLREIPGADPDHLAARARRRGQVGPALWLPGVP
jgi:NAD(P)H-dependent flavin oxidoreductase YrpB (nitropropane dioxygenase family)